MGLAPRVAPWSTSSSAGPCLPAPSVRAAGTEQRGPRTGSAPTSHHFFCARAAAAETRAPEKSGRRQPGTSSAPCRAAPRCSLLLAASKRLAAQRPASLRSASDPARARPAPAGAAAIMNAQVIQLEDGWNKLKTGGVLKIEEILEDASGGVYKHRISTDEYSQLYTCALPPLRPSSARRGSRARASPRPRLCAGRSTPCARRSRQTTGASRCTTTIARLSSTT